MKECPKDKILNPKTNRCVNIKGTIGKKIMKDKINLILAMKIIVAI